MTLGQIVEANKKDLVIFEWHKRLFIKEQEYRNINRSVVSSITKLNLNGEGGYIVDYISGYCYWDSKIKSLVNLNEDEKFSLSSELAEYSILDNVEKSDNGKDSLFVTVWEGVKMLYKNAMEAVN